MSICVRFSCYFFFFKQKTAYDMRISDWSSDVCSSDLERTVAIRNPSGIADNEDGVYFVVKRLINGQYVRYIEKLHTRQFSVVEDCFFVDCGLSYDNPKIGRASCRERVCQYV